MCNHTEEISEGKTRKEISECEKLQLQNIPWVWKAVWWLLAAEGAGENLWRKEKSVTTDHWCHAYWEQF